MQSILADLVAEQQALDQYIQTVSEREWDRPLPVWGKSIRKFVTRLAKGEELALDAISGTGELVTEARRSPTVEKFLDATAGAGDTRRPQEILGWWRGARADVVGALADTEPDDVIAWVGRRLSAKAFASGLLAEAWVRGLDLHRAFAAESTDTPRLRHIAWLGWERLAEGFEQAHEPFAPVRLEVIGPDFSKWIFGPTDAPNLVTGRAGQWCRLAVRRLEPDNAALQISGPIARKALELASARL